MIPTTTPPQLTVTRVFDAPRSTVYRAFTEPDEVREWWGPTGHATPREDMDFDVRPGGHERWTEVSDTDAEVRVAITFDLAEVVDGELLDGTMHVDGHLPHGFQPFATRLRIEFHDEADGRTRLEISQWLPAHLAAPSDNGWSEAFTKLDAFLAREPRRGQDRS